MTDFVDDLERELLAAARRRTARRRHRLPRIAPRPLLALAALAAAFGIVTLIAGHEAEPEPLVTSPRSVAPLRMTDVLVLNETTTSGLAAVTRDELAVKLGVNFMVDTGPIHRRRETVVQALDGGSVPLARAVAKALDARFAPGRLEHTVETLIQGRTPRVVVFVGSDRMR